jgi:hypothetical protein
VVENFLRGEIQEESRSGGELPAGAAGDGGSKQVRGVQAPQGPG